MVMMNILDVIIVRPQTCATLRLTFTKNFSCY